MQISVSNPIFQTWVFGVLFLFTVLFSVKKANGQFFGISKTEELKGLAILVIIFSHICYFLSKDTTFLYPFSIFAGVGVNLFLFLSGFGLTVSSLRTPLKIVDFYKKRLKKLFTPLWLVIFTLLLIDSIFLKKMYSTQEVWQALIGFFPKADLFQNIDSPLWYFSLIFFYYLIFPLFFWRKFLYFSPPLILLVSYLVLKLPLLIDRDVLNLYKLHSVSFPIGVLFALLINDQNLIKFKMEFKRLFLFSNLKYLLVIIFMVLFAYTSVNSGVGVGKATEQAVSLITMFSIIFVFIAKGFEFKLFNLFGRYSYEIYLIHWPILSRYGLLYIVLPAYLATYLYLIIFLGASYLLQKVERYF